MKKFSSLSVAALMLPGFTGCISLPTMTESKSVNLTQRETRAIWLSFPFWDLSVEQKGSVVAYLQEKGINKVYLSVYDNGIARWPSKTLVQNGMASAGNPDEFLKVVALFRRHKIAVAGFFEGGMSVFLNQPLAAKHPELFQRCQGEIASGEHGGHLMAFLDPSNDTARKLLIDSLAELAADPSKLEEIQLDRFRYTHKDWNLCTNHSGNSDPSYVNSLVKEAYQRIKSVRKEIVVSASPVGSYGFWKLNQRWGQWVQGGYIDAIVSQAYIDPVDLKSCAKGTPDSIPRRQTVAIFKAELASLMGRPDLLEKAVSEFQSLGGDLGVLELDQRRPMARARESELAKPLRPVPIPIHIGYMAHQFDDSECVFAEMEAARTLGFNDSALWVSGVAPDVNGKPNREIADNLDLLKQRNWGAPKP